MPFKLAQADCDTGGWARSSKPRDASLRKAEKRWARRSYEHHVGEDWEFQCGGCTFFAALGADYGICWNENSPLDGCITFEHGGCAVHSERPSAEGKDDG